MAGLSGEHARAPAATRAGRTAGDRGQSDAACDRRQCSQCGPRNECDRGNGRCRKCATRSCCAHHADHDYTRGVSSRCSRSDHDCTDGVCSDVGRYSGFIGCNASERPRYDDCSDNNWRSSINSGDICCGYSGSASKYSSHNGVGSTCSDIDRTACRGTAARSTGSGGSAGERPTRCSAHRGAASTAR